jgi:dipeptidyl aminopeptidase/acylaminoacyl peptidase
MKNMIFRVFSIIMLLFLSGWLVAPQPAVAETNDLDALAVRSVVTGYLTGLQTRYLDQATLSAFYLADDIAQSEVVQSVSELQIDAFAIAEMAEFGTDTYQVTVTLTPDNRILLMQVSRVNNRWQITELRWSVGETVPSTVSDSAPQGSPASPSTTDSNAGSLDSLGTLIIQTESGGDFYLVTDNGAGLRYLSSGIDPALSPDGTKIAFTRWSSGDDGAVWIYDLTSGEEWPLLGAMRQVKSPTWSVDGSQLIVSYQSGGRPYIEAVCTDPGSRIPRGAYDINRGSETGRICYKLPADPYRKLRRIDVASGEFEDLPSYTYSFAPTWDPANPWRVVYVGERGLIQLDLNRAEYFAFTDDVRDRGPVFSPDGRFVAVSYKQDSHWEVYTISTADGTRTRLTSSSFLDDTPANNAAPAWSPDGSQIAFVTDRTGQWEFWVMDADGSNQRPLLSPEVAAQLSVQYHGVDERLISWGN